MNNEKPSRPSGGMARARAKRTGRSKSLPISRPIMFALALIVAGAIFLFWPRGESPPAGIGEQFSVVTAENSLGSPIFGTLVFHGTGKITGSILDDRCIVTPLSEKMVFHKWLEIFLY